MTMPTFLQIFVFLGFLVGCASFLFQGWVFGYQRAWWTWPAKKPWPYAPRRKNRD